MFLLWHVPKINQEYIVMQKDPKTCSPVFDQSFSEEKGSTDGVSVIT